MLACYDLNYPTLPLLYLEVQRFAVYRLTAASRWALLG